MSERFLAIEEMLAKTEHCQATTQRMLAENAQIQARKNQILADIGYRLISVIETYVHNHIFF